MFLGGMVESTARSMILSSLQAVVSASAECWREGQGREGGTGGGREGGREGGTEEGWRDGGGRRECVKEEGRGVPN